MEWAAQTDPPTHSPPPHTPAELLSRARESSTSVAESSAQQGAEELENWVLPAALLLGDLGLALSVLQFPPLYNGDKDTDPPLCSAL